MAQPGSVKGMATGANIIVNHNAIWTPQYGCADPRDQVAQVVLAQLQQIDPQPYYFRTHKCSE